MLKIRSTRTSYCVFCMDHITVTFLPVQYLLIVLYIGEGMCLLLGMDWTFVYVILFNLSSDRVQITSIPPVPYDSQKKKTAIVFM